MIKSILPFPQRREHSNIKALDPRLRGDDDLIRDSLSFKTSRARDLGNYTGV